jgi:hypothetical protein
LEYSSLGHSATAWSTAQHGTAGQHTRCSPAWHVAHVAVFPPWHSD